MMGEEHRDRIGCFFRKREGFDGPTVLLECQETRFNEPRIRNSTNHISELGSSHLQRMNREFEGVDNSNPRYFGKIGADVLVPVP